MTDQTSKRVYLSRGGKIEFLNKKAGSKGYITPLDLKEITTCHRGGETLKHACQVKADRWVIEGLLFPATGESPINVITCQLKSEIRL
jgi:hypothetical protein